MCLTPLLPLADTSNVSLVISTSMCCAINILSERFLVMLKILIKTGAASVHNTVVASAHTDGQAQNSGGTLGA